MDFGVPSVSAAQYTLSGTDVTSLTAAGKDMADSGVSSLTAIFLILIPLLIWAFVKKVILRHTHA